MSTVLASVTARCVHCSWRTDQDDSQALHEVREIHELIHPGGTVLVVVDADEPEPIRSEPEPAGTDGRRPRGYWTRERLIEALQAFYREQGRSPTQGELRVPLPSNAALTREFGSMSKAYEAAEIPARARGGRHVAAEPPLTPKGHADGQKRGPITAGPVPREASQGTADGTLVALARALEQADEEWGNAIVAMEDAKDRYDAAKERLREAVEALTARLELV